MDSYLSNLARTLAERIELHGQVCNETRTSYEDCCCLPDWKKRRKYVEAVIREAIDKTIDVAEKVAQAWGNSESCEHHDDNPCCHVRTGAGIAAAIRSLKQSNSGNQRIGNQHH